MPEPVLSADGHIDLPCLPPTLFTERAPRALRDRMPRVVNSDKGPRWVAGDGAPLGIAGGMGSLGRAYEPGQIRRADRMAETGLYADQARGLLRTSLPELRLKDQERDGVLGEVIYGILGAAGRVKDDEAASAMLRIYNDFAHEFQSHAPERFAMIGCLPVSSVSSGSSPEHAVAELVRCRELGLRGVELPIVDGMMPLWREEWDPLWAAAADCGLAVHLHTVGGSFDQRWVERREHYLPFLASVLTGFQMAMADHIAAVIFGGALERFPALRIVMGESGLGWIPYVLERMDYEWQDQFRNLPLSMPPSAYWRRQMLATYQQDEVGIENLERIGIENVMWGSDFPHPDGVWPDSQEHLARQLGGLAPEVRHKIVFANAARVYGFPAVGASSSTQPDA
ncbi:MAG: amidohydrolase family protein [Myxococcota bacterium]|nr:amidohydrolase family protein [Myxococcota bacterium]